MSHTPRTDLIVADVGGGHRLLRAGIGGVHRHLLTVKHPLEVVACLLNETAPISAVFAPSRDPNFDTLSLFAFMRDEFPQVGRIAYGGRGAAQADAAERGAAQAFTFAAVGASAEPDGKGCRLQTDAGLLAAWKSGDRTAFDQLDRRYRNRIHRKLTPDRLDGADADDLVQETLLGLLVTRHAPATSRSFGELIENLCSKSLAAQTRGRLRRLRLHEACADATRGERAGRLRGQRPDERVLFGELVARVNAAVDDLPAGCREPFRMCALQGYSPTRAGRSLHMSAAAVTMWVARARGFIAERLDRTAA